MSDQRLESFANPVVRWETLPGLPGEGPVAKHFHTGHPTPWKEGFVVRFWNQDGTEWVGNFQAGWTKFSDVIELPEARLALIFAEGACYRLPMNDPKQVAVVGDGATGALVGENGMLIVAGRPGYISALDRNAIMVWIRDDFGADGLILKSCRSGVVVAAVEDWEGNWRTVRVAEIDGSDVP